MSLSWKGSNTDDFDIFWCNLDFKESLCGNYNHATSTDNDNLANLVFTLRLSIEDASAFPRIINYGYKQNVVLCATL